MAVARQFELQAIHYLRADIAYNTPNIANGIEIGAVPAGAKLEQIKVYVDEAFNAMTWMASPYTWETIGWPSDISQFTRETANEFFATYYAPNNITAVLVGDFNPDTATALAEKYFGRIPANPKGVPEVTAALLKTIQAVREPAKTPEPVS